MKLHIACKSDQCGTMDQDREDAKKQKKQLFPAALGPHAPKAQGQLRLWGKALEFVFFRKTGE
ncbi:MAG: hypothetical protein AB7I41_19690 [Candidatus Sericytochromatia bacterium]